MFEPIILAAIAGTYLLAGTVKGVIGMGLPTVSLALMVLVVELPDAMVLPLVSSFVTNLWQGVVGGHIRNLLTRLWPFLLMATVSVYIGVKVLISVDLALLSALLGILLIAYSAVNLAGFRLTTSIRNEKWAGPLAGLVNGVLTGMTGSAVIPGVMFLQSIGLSRDRLIQAMGLLFSISALALAIALQQNNLFTLEHAVLSTAALLPAIMGMMLGQKIRKTLSEIRFKKVFFISLLVLGAYIVAKAYFTS